MKQTKLSAAVMALAFAFLLNLPAHAQLTSYNEGDLLLGFEQQNGSGGVAANDYVIDLGSVSQFIGANSSFTVTIPTAALTSAFGSGWANNSNAGSLVQWGVVGGSDGNDLLTVGSVTLQKNTLFYTQAEFTVGTQSTPPATASNSIQSNANSSIQSFALFSFQGQTETTTGVNGAIFASNDSNGWSGNHPSTTGFNTGKNVEQPSSGTFTGPTNSQLDLYQLNNKTNTPGSTAILLGHFNLSSGGVLTFTPVGGGGTPPTQLSFSQWTTKYSTGDATDTPENDDVPNLLKFLTGIDPTRPMTAADRAALPTIGTNSNDDITITYGQSGSISGLTVNVQTSTDLQTWTTLNSTQYTQQPTGQNDPNGDPYIEVDVLTHASKLFVRLVLTSL